MEALWNEKKNLDHEDKRVTPLPVAPSPFYSSWKKMKFESCNHDTVGKGAKP